MRKLILIIAVMFLISGCFNYSEVLEFQEDGSGTVQMKFEVDDAYLEQMKLMYEQLAESMPDFEYPEKVEDMMFPKAQIEQTLSEENSGVKLISYEVLKEDGIRVWNMKYSFTDINNIDALDKALYPEDDAEYYESEEMTEIQTEEDIPLLTKQADGTLLYSRLFKDDQKNPPDEEDIFYEDDLYYDDEGNYVEDEEADPYDNELEAGIEKYVDDIAGSANFTGDYKMKFTIKFPGKIIESNADEVNGNTASWEYDLKDVENSTFEQRAVIQP